VTLAVDDRSSARALPGAAPSDTALTDPARTPLTYGLIARSNTADTN